MSKYVNDMTNEEIWEMLESKMRKNSLQRFNSYEVSLLKMYGYDYNYYTESDVHKAIAIAYRSGYERAMKGRPFKIGEKKKKGGHWESIDPNNLPKEGTRVRYARECTSYGNNMVKLGDEGVVEWNGVYKPDWFGVKLDNPRGWMKWACFDDEEDSLDMWVEDDE